jgi:hypothetical protein
LTTARARSVVQEHLGLHAGQWPDLSPDNLAVFGFADGFLGAFTENSKKMLAPVKTRNMFLTHN